MKHVHVSVKTIKCAKEFIAGIVQFVRMVSIYEVLLTIQWLCAMK